jgi:hypothetical protein
VKTGRRAVRMKSFSMPGVSAGAIVEYRWKEIHNNPRILYARLPFQREYPVRRVTYYVKPLLREYTGYTMAIWPFHCHPSPPIAERDGFDSIYLENVPAFQEEPMMPAEPDVKQWALIYYSENQQRDPQKYWNDTGKRLYNEELKPALHINDEIKKAAKNATEGADTDDKKMLALIRYIRGHMRDLNGLQVTDEERAKLIKNFPKDRLRTSIDVFKSGIGSENELNTLLAAMASQVGLEARPALVGNRDDVTFNPQLTDDYFLRSIDMAVNIGGKWKLYDVSARNNPAGMLSSLEEGMKALIGDPKAPFFVDVPIAAPAESRAIHTGNFTLSAEGMLDGDVVEALSGHLGAERRSAMRGESEARRLEMAKERIINVFTEAEITNVKIDAFDDPDKPLRISYHVKIEHYAQRTGKRILFQPMYFQRGEPAVFSAAERKYAMVFPFAWSESDNFTISLPEGFVLDNASNDPALNFGAPGSYDLKFSTRGKRDFICKREFVFGNQQQIVFPAQSYAAVKQVFDEIRARDNVTISLKADEASK